MLTSIKTRLIAIGLAAVIGSRRHRAARRRHHRRRRHLRLSGPVQVVGQPTTTKTGNKINYQSIGSGGGIAQIKAGTVDFGSSDKPLEPKDSHDVGPRPVPVGDRRRRAGGQHRRRRRRARSSFTGPLLADIFLGKITKWNDPAIAAAQSRPEAAATARSPSCIARTVRARRSTSSTTCPRSSPEWKAKVGEGTSVSWPVGVGGKGNEGVAAYVKQIKGSIGYVELRLRAAEQDGLRADAERGRQVRAAERGERSRPPPPAPTGSNAKDFHLS